MVKKTWSSLLGPLALEKFNSNENLVSCCYHFGSADFIRDMLLTFYLVQGTILVLHEGTRLNHVDQWDSNAKLDFVK